MLTNNMMSENKKKAGNTIKLTTFNEGANKKIEKPMKHNIPIPIPNPYNIL